MADLITAPLGGMRDYLPLDVLRRAYVTETVERVYQRYGFQPLETPAILGHVGLPDPKLIPGNFSRCPIAGIMAITGCS